MLYEATNCQQATWAMFYASYTLIGYGFNGIHKEFLHWDKNGLSLKDDISCNDIVGMWKDPEPKTITLTLPCPLKELIDKAWFINDHFRIEYVNRSENPHNVHQQALNGGRYFNSKEDAQAWLDAMRNKDIDTAMMIALKHISACYLGDYVPMDWDIHNAINALQTIAILSNLNIEDCVQHAYDQIKDRKGRLIDGVFVKEEDL